MSPYVFALLTGLFSGGHCLAMCGPLAFAIPSANRGWRLVSEKFYYQVGRVFTYVFLGFFCGLIGRQFWMLGLQQVISIVTGVLVLASALSAIVKWKHRRLLVAIPVTKLISLAMKKNAGHFTIGLLNGFLPCSMVWLALAGAINMGSVGSAMIYMLFFGLGTVPLLFVAMLGWELAGPLTRKRLAKAAPLFMLAVGGWLVARGTVMDIQGRQAHHTPRGEVPWCGK